MGDINDSIDKSALEQDLSQESLNEDVMALLEKHVNEKTANAPVTAFSDGALPSATCKTTSVVSAQWSGAISTPLLPLSASSSTIRRQYVDIKEKIEENKSLKAENFELKKKLFIVMRELPTMKDAKGKDFTEDYLECRDQLYNEQTRRMEAEEQLRTAKSDFLELTKKHEQEAEEWAVRNKRLHEERDRLSEEYNMQRRELHTKAQQINKLTMQVEVLSRQMSAEDGNDSQADTSVSNVSVMSSRDRIIEELKSSIVEMTVKEEQRTHLVEQIDTLNADVAKLNAELDEQRRAFAEERKLRMNARETITQLHDKLRKAQQCADDLKEEISKKKEAYESELSKMRKCVETRNRAINALMKKMPYDLKFSAFPDELPEEAFASIDSEETTTDDNPIVQKLLHRIVEISKTNTKLRDEVERLKKAGAFDQSFELSEDRGRSTDEESSVWDPNRLRAENKKATAILAREGLANVDSSCEEMIRMKMREFDRASTGGRSALKMAALDREPSLTSPSLIPSDAPQMSAMADLYSHSIAALDDLDTLRKSVSLLRRISVRLFEKLRGSATFLQSLLDELGQSEKGRAFIREIETMRIEFGRSANTAAEILNGVDAAERSISDFRAQVERSMNYSMISVSTTRIDFNMTASKRIDSSTNAVATDRSLKYVVDESQHGSTAQAESEISILRTKIADLEGEHSILERKFNATIQQKVELEKKITALEKANAEKSHRESELLEQIETITSKMEELKAQTAEDEFELRRIVDEVQGRCRDLEMKRCDLELRLESSQRTVKEKTAEVEKINDCLRVREEQFNRYRGDCLLLEAKTRELIEAVKESIEAMPSKVVRDIATSSRDIPDVRSSTAHKQISEQIAQMDVHITELRAELGCVRVVLEECEANRKTAENNCYLLTEQLKKQQVDMAKYKKTAEAVVQRRAQMKMVGTQSEMCMMDISALEAEIKKLKITNVTTEENFREMCKTVMELEEKANKFDQISVTGRTNMGMMTSLNCSDIKEMEQKLGAYVSFASKMYDLLGKWSRKEHVLSKSSFSTADLERMYQKMVRIQKITDDEIISLKTKLETIKLYDCNYPISSGHKRDSSSSQRTSPGGMKLALSDGAMISRSVSPASLEAEQLEVVRSELSAGDVSEMYRSSHSVVELIKDILGSNAAALKEEEITEALQKARTIRSRLAALCNRLTQFEKAKENVDPTDSPESLRAENVKLQLALNDAEAMLKSSHEKFRAQPNSEAMCEAIVRELGKISRAMRSTTRDVCRYRKMRHAATRARTESS